MFQTKFIDIGDWIIEMTEDHENKKTRTSTFVMESINEEPVAVGSEKNPGAITGLLLRNKYKGIHRKSGIRSSIAHEILFSNGNQTSRGPDVHFSPFL